MQNIDVRFNATSNFSKVRGDLAALEAQAASLNSVFEKGAMAKRPMITDPAAWSQGTATVNRASQVYRDAAASSGLFTTQQIRATSETEKYTKALQKQQLSFGDMRKHAGIMKEVYNDQLRMQRMTAHSWGTDALGRQVTDITIPKGIPEELDNMRRRMGMFGNMAASAGTQVVNLGKNIQWSGRQLMVGFTYPMAMFGAAAGVMAYKVEAAFGDINKVYDVSNEAINNATKREQELGDVRVRSMQEAKKAAQDYGVTISSTLEIEQRLAATGLTGEKLMKSVDEVQRISRIGDIDASQTTDMVIALQTAFRDTIKDSKDLTGTLNFMNAASNATSLSLQDIAEATPRTAAALAAVGVTAKEMTVMLVSMRESGVDAAQAANGLKSASSALLKPSADIAKYVKTVSHGRIEIQKFAKETGGNLYKALGMLARQMEGLKPYEKQQILTGLFGRYQVGRVTGMIKNLNDAFQGVPNQTNKAMELMSRSVADNAKVAEQSLKAMTDNSAGRLRKAWANLQISLVDVGKPFLVVATTFLNAVTKIMDGFNKMDDWKKHMIMIAAGALALAGPLIMTAGLVMNLTGQFIKGVGSIAKFLGISTLVTKEERAATLITEQHNKALSNQTAVIGSLVTETQVLIESMQRAEMLVTARIGGEEALGEAMVTEAEQASRTAAAVAEAEVIKQKELLATREGALAANDAMIAGAQAAAKRGIYGEVVPHPVPSAPVTPPNPAMMRGARASDVANQSEEYRRNVIDANAIAAAETKAAEQRAISVNRTNAQAVIQERVKKAVTGTNLAMGAMGLSMALMMVSSNHVVDNIAKWGTVAAIGVPALKGMLSAVGGIAGAGADAARKFRAANVAVLATAGSTGVLSAGIRGVGAAIDTALGPLGWLVLGVTAIAGIFMAAKHHSDALKKQQEDLIKKQVAATHAMDISTASIATSMGKAAGSYRQISNMKPGMSGVNANDNQMLERYNFYKSSEGDADRKGLQDTKGNLKATSDLIDTARTKFVDLQVQGHDTAKQAAVDLQAMLEAAGASATRAAAIVEGVYKHLGDVTKSDWSKPLADQITYLQHIAGGQLSEVGSRAVAGQTANGARVSFATDIDAGTVKKLQTQGAKAGQIVTQALATAASPEQAQKIWKAYMDAATSQWQVGYKQLMDSAERGAGGLQKVFKDYGIKSGADFSDAFANNADFRKALANAQKGASPVLGAQVDAAIKSGKAYEASLIKPLSKAAGFLADNLTTASAAMVDFGNVAKFQTSGDALKNLKAESAAYLKYAGIRESIDEMMKHPHDARSLLDLQGQLNSSGKVLARQVNALNKAYGFKQGRTAAQALYNLMNRIKVGTNGATDAANKLSGALHSLPTRMTIRINASEAAGVTKDAMSAVQDAMATSAESKFNAGWDAKMASAQAGWDAKIASQQNRAEAASKALEDHWTKRKDAVTAAYQRRMDAVQREIDAETKADDTRKRIFEAEKARLKALADLQNNNIDFNTALNEGRLDDAAKIQNNSIANNASNEMDSEAAKSEAATKAHTDALQKKNDELSKQRDNELKKMEKMEAKQTASLQRMQARRAAALQKESKAAMASMQKQRDYDEAMLEQRLTLFKAYTARNQKDLEKWMRQVGLSYDDFGSDVKAKGESWAKYFRTALSDQIRIAGTSVMNDKIWTKVGKTMGDQIVKGLGFNGMADFNKFVRTGTLGKNKPAETHHTGGVVGDGGGSRGNIPSTYRGLHPSEQMVRAQKGEYIVNAKASRENRPLLDAVNNGGIMDASKRGVMGGMGPQNGGTFNDTGAFKLRANPGIPGLMSGVIAQEFKAGISTGMQNAYNKAYTKYAASLISGTYVGTAGNYGNTSFGGEAMKNAAIIASVGSSMGMSKRDIEIGIMTAITESGLKNLHGGDRDSQGLFQQRPSMGWGTVAQVTNPKYAAGKFFSALKGNKDREDMSPWEAAQSVQRSAFADGSNYRQYWDEATAIFNKGLKKNAKGGYNSVAGGGFIAGAGGRHRPINSRNHGPIHDSYTGYPAVDFPTPVGTPIYAVANGRISRSFDIKGFEPRNSVQNGYRSYGKVEYLKTDAGPEVLYAHLSRRSANAGQRVTGGSVIGYSGNTGHSTGPHLHFGANNGPLAWLRKGGEIKWDNTPAILHQGETVLTKNLTSQFKDNVASGGGDSYTVTVDMRGAVIKEDVDIEKAVDAAIDKRNAKLGRKRVVR